jgi:hypothetical protein
MMANVDHLERALSLLLSKLKDARGTEIELRGDFYWDIAPKELYDPYNDPHTITLGQLSDDLERIEKILETNEGVPYDIKRIASILVALSTENPI